MAELKPTPQHAGLAAIANALKGARGAIDVVNVPYLGPLGQLLIGRSPEEVEEWSYGNAPMQVPPMSRIPQVKQGRKQQLADALFTGLDISPLATASARAVRAIPGAIQHGAEQFARANVPAHVMKPKGGNWTATNSVGETLRGLRRPAHNEVTVNAAGELVSTPNTATYVNSWIEGPLTKYVKTRMASPEDEVRRLAEEGVLHYVPAPAGEHPSISLARQREVAGFPEGGVGVEPLARAWEKATDNAIHRTTAGELRDPSGWISEGFQKELEANPWLNAVPANTPVYDTFRPVFGRELGLPHLIDELHNALNPRSGLPRHLQLSPEAMKNLSMEKAVRRVSDINDWRAAQKVEANRKLAEQASLVREYAENNPKGLRWVELKAPEVPKQEPALDFDGNPIDHYKAPKPDRQALEEQLKYEGDTMGHCVGGYCDDVLEGRSRIFSLRDAKGEPHVTVEVAPNSPKYNTDTIPNKETPQEGFRIQQIKGKQNRAPNEEYLPFVQDFIRNSPLGTPWSEIGDLQNTGLRRSRDVWNDLEQQRIREAGKEVGDYVTKDDINAIGQTVWPDTWGKFSVGGSVRNSLPPQYAQGIIAAVREALRNAT